MTNTLGLESVENNEHTEMRNTGAFRYLPSTLSVRFRHTGLFLAQKRTLWS